ncbi:MAG: ABC transporter substrate-binding protein [Spirochaetales bacterium]|nr:ABC transporter substrate-binding protein [Spirochaetales bacterium]
MTGLRTVFRRSSLLLMLIFLLSCSGKDPVVIGFLGSLSGPNADLGEAGRNGALLAVEDYNKAGGIKGRPVKVVVKDHQMSPEQLSHISGEFTRAGVDVVIGPYTSVMTRIMIPIAEAKDMLLISPTASSSEFFEKDDNLIRLNHTTSENSRVYTAYLAAADVMSCSVIYDTQNAEFTESWLNDFAGSYEAAGGRILVRERINSKLDTDFSEELNSVIDSGAEMLLIIANSIDSATLVQQLRQTGSDLQVYFSEWAGTRQLIELGGKAVEGSIVMQSFDPFDESPQFQEFRDKYKQRYQREPSFASVLSYDACSVLFQALEGRSRNQTVKEAILLNGPYTGIQEPLNISEFGDTRRKNVFSVIREGQFRKIE